MPVIYRTELVDDCGDPLLTVCSLAEPDPDVLDMLGAVAERFRLNVDGYRTERLIACRGCGCTDDNACTGGCEWVPGEADLCSRCELAERRAAAGAGAAVSETTMPQQDVVLGPCCVCERPGATVIVMLEKLAPVAGHGWGCIVCGLSPSGACAVACEACAAAPGFPETLRFACRGYPGIDGRIPIGALAGEHKHDAERHRQEGFDELDELDKFYDFSEEGAGDG